MSLQFQGRLTTAATSCWSLLKKEKRVVEKILSWISMNVNSSYLEYQVLSDICVIGHKFDRFSVKSGHLSKAEALKGSESKPFHRTANKKDVLIY